MDLRSRRRRVRQRAGGEEPAVHARYRDRRHALRAADQHAALELGAALDGDLRGVGEVPQQPFAQVSGQGAHVGADRAGGADEVDQHGGALRDVAEGDALVAAAPAHHVEVDVEHLELRGPVAGEHRRVPPVDRRAGGLARYALVVRVTGRRPGQLGAESQVGLGGVGVVHGPGGDGAGEAAGVLDDASGGALLGEQGLPGGDGDVAADGEEVRPVVRRHAGADADDADVVDAGTGGLVHPEVAEGDELALGLRRRSADEVVAADEDVDAVVAAGDGPVVRVGVHARAVARHTGPQPPGQRVRHAPGGEETDHQHTDDTGQRARQAHFPKFSTFFMSHILKYDACLY